MTRRQGRFRRRFGDWLFSPTVVAIFLGVLGLLIGVGGYANQYCSSDFCNSLPNLGEGLARFIKDFYGNISTTLVGIAIAVFTIDRANERRTERQAKEQLKLQLIRELGSSDNGIALRAVQELRAHRWLIDGSVNGANLWRADLQRAYLSDANLQGVYLLNANLQEAILENADLQRAILEHADLQRVFLHRANLKVAQMHSANLQGACLSCANLQQTDLRDANLQRADLGVANLQGANLPSANLQGSNLGGAGLREATLAGASLQKASLAWANLQRVRELTDQQLIAAKMLQGATMPDSSRYDGRFNLKGDFESAKSNNISLDDSIAIARFYGVTLEVYLYGQEWARENLPRLRHEAGLEQEEAAETVETPQPEEPPPAVPSSDTLRPKRTIIGGASRW